MRRWLAALAMGALAAAGAACSGGVPSSVGGVETSAAGIADFVRSGESYADWLAEPAPHASSGPHSGNVRVFYNDLLADSLAAGNDRHPMGSVVVKELLDFDDGSFIGHAVMLKISDGEGDDSWVFFEGFTQDDYAEPYYGQADNLCTGCHSQGRDYILSTFPPAVMTAD